MDIIIMLITVDSCHLSVGITHSDWLSLYCITLVSVISFMKLTWFLLT